MTSKRKYKSQEHYDRLISESETNIKELWGKIDKYKKEIRDHTEVIKDCEFSISVLEKSHYYAYIVAVDEEVKYIGKGSHDRWKHAVSGTSSVKELNRDYFEGKHIEVYQWKGNLDEDQALDQERFLILNILAEESALYNTTALDPNKDVFQYYDMPNYCFVEWSKKLGGVNEPDKDTLRSLYKEREDRAEAYHDWIAYEHSSFEEL